MSITELTIVIPTYRRVDSLKRALAALTTQTRPAIEILVIDQNPSGWLGEQLGHLHESIELLWTPKANASAARNLGFVRATADTVLFIDDDLVPEADFLARALSRLDANPDIGCLCPVIVTDAEGLATATRDQRRQALRSHDKTPEILMMPSVISAAMFFRRDTYERSGGFDELLFDYARAGEDQELCFRMTKRNLEIWLDTSLAIYHDENVQGGCELRTRPFWESRERAIRSNVLRARLHARGRIEIAPMIRLVRSAFLNRDMVRNSPAWTLRNARLLAEALVDSGRMLRDRGESVPDTRVVDHIGRHRLQETPRRTAK